VLNKPAVIKDDRLLEWCGSHKVKGCGTSREMDCDDPPTRLVSQCEYCRSEAQRDADYEWHLQQLSKIKHELESQLGFSDVIPSWQMFWQKYLDKEGE
jgi:hypothetical protein